MVICPSSCLKDRKSIQLSGWRHFCYTSLTRITQYYLCAAKCKALSYQSVRLFGKMALWKKEIKYLDVSWEQYHSYANFTLKSQTWDPGGFPRQGIWTMLSGMHKVGLLGWMILVGPFQFSIFCTWGQKKRSLRVWEVSFAFHKRIPKHMLSWEGFTLPGIHKMLLRTSKCFSVKGQDLQYNRPPTQKHYKGLFHSITFQHEKQTYNLGGVFIFYPKSYFTQAVIHCSNDWLQDSTSSQDVHAKILRRNLAFQKLMTNFTFQLKHTIKTAIRG